MIAASELAERRQLSFWDALILTSAAAMGARCLLSEDVRHDEVIEGVRIVNPFVS